MFGPLNFLWAKAIIGNDGKMTQVRCIICSQVEKRQKLLVLKLDGLRKHASCRKTTSMGLGVVVSEYYMNSSSQHVKNK
jgi:hypothetical protein